MSRIFDALQRSEAERSGNESASVPQGQELLREAERYAASDWQPANSEKRPEAGRTAAPGAVSTIELLNAPASEYPTEAFASDFLSAEQRSELLKTTASLPISIPARNRLSSLTDRESPTAEAIRLLALRLRDIRRTRPLKKVLVTSTIPKEGKSTISANLAVTLARKADEKVLLIEGDLRLPGITGIFGVEKRQGLCELLNGKRDLLHSVYRLDSAGIWILPAGSSPDDPLEILQSKQMSSLMDQMTAYFDWVVIDSPPVLPLADTSIWMRLADGVLLVARQGVTEKRQLQKGLDALDSEKVLGALLNGSKASPYSGYYYSRSDNS